ncbi:unnamed protein product [Phytophthora fragariaefolia]|uniref:Unnamed protein product n=1 Tax=Phytophthora fragariaefolia TaxID=1490495 RepID=A0A9W6TUG0_9STRA|nr:unnamed protein product [Phytophthora fragariaefolia]
MVVVDLYLVTDRGLSAASNGSLNVTLYGKEQLVLKRARLSDDILHHKVSKVTLTLAYDTAVEYVKVSQCYFDLVGRCGYHTDLKNSFDLLFLAEDGNELIVAAKLATPSVFRRLATQEKPKATPSRSLAYLPNVNGRRIRVMSQPARAQGTKTNELSSMHTVVDGTNEPVDIPLFDVLGEIRRVEPGNRNFDLVSVETEWPSASAIKTAKIGGFPAKSVIMDGNVVTSWRMVRQSSVLKLHLRDDFTSECTFKLVVQGRVSRTVIQYAKTYCVAVRQQTIVDEIKSFSRGHGLSSESGYGNTTNASRRLDAVNTISTAAASLKLFPLNIDLEANAPLHLLVSKLLPSYVTTTTAICNIRFIVFNLDNAISLVKTPSFGPQNVSDTHNPTILHVCREILLVWLKPDVTDMQALIQIEIVNTQNTVLASMPLVWSVFPSIKLPVTSRLLVGAYNRLAGDTLKLMLNYSDVPDTSRVDVVVDNCSVLNVETIRDAKSTSEECTFLLKAYNSNTDITSGIKITQQQKTAFRVSIEVITSKLEQKNDDMTWLHSVSNVASYTLHFCALETANPEVQIMRKGEARHFLFTDFVFKILGSSLPESHVATNIYIVSDDELFTNLNMFQVGGKPAQLEAYNATASFITLSAKTASYFTYIPFQLGSFRVDVMVEWTDVSSSKSGCYFVQNVAVSVLPSFSQPLFASPFVFSQKVLQGGSAKITIPLMETKNIESECLTLAVALNTTNGDVAIKYGTRDHHASSDDPPYFFLIEREANLRTVRQLVISARPSDTFAGILRFYIGLGSLSFDDKMTPFADQYAELLTIREIDVEWIPIAETDMPMMSKEANYRSLPTRLLGNSAISFKYQMTSGKFERQYIDPMSSKCTKQAFVVPTDSSTISTYVVLNSSETRSVWSSDSAVINQDQWNYAESVIDIAYPSTAEIVFRGIASADDTLRLKEITIHDFVQEAMVGIINFVHATGGMIYIEVNTAKSIPQPILLRAYVRRLHTNDSPTLSFTGKNYSLLMICCHTNRVPYCIIEGDDLQCSACETTTTMYPCTGASGIVFDSPAQCRKLCSAVETQLKFTPDAVVRSAQMVPFPIADPFTVEFWVFREGFSIDLSSEQLLLLYGTQEGSLSITLSSYITISRCGNLLRIPHGIPLRQWTHVAIVSDASNDIALFMNGKQVANGLLSKKDCDIRIWKVARDPEAIFTSFQKNVFDPDLILLLLFNAAENTNWFPSSTDGSPNNIDFMVQGVNVTSTRAIKSFGVAGDGRCYYKLIESVVNPLSSTSCDKTCGDGSLRTCGSSTNSNVASVYRRGSIGVGGLSPLTDYEVLVEFVTNDNSEYEITQPLVGSTSNATVPGKVKYLNIVEQFDDAVEIQWSPVDDDGGSEIDSYFIYVNGVNVATTTSGNVWSMTLYVPETQGSNKISIQALNAVGMGPLSDPFPLLVYSDNTTPNVPDSPSVISVSGGTVTLTLDSTTTLSVETLSSVLEIQQRELSVIHFTESIFQRNGSSTVIYKLRHDTVYIFRVFTISKNGVQSPFSIPISIRTGDRESPSKTPLPVVADVTGGLPIAQYDIFLFRDNKFTKWTSTVASSTSDDTMICMTRDADGAHLLPETSYTIKVLALQVDASCDTLANDGFESDEVTVTTKKAAIPAPPPRPTLLQIFGCTALVMATPPDDFGGTEVTGMVIAVFLPSSILLETFSVTLSSTGVTVRNLLARTTYLVKAFVTTPIGSTDLSEALTFETEDPSPPGKLAGLYVTHFDSTTARLQWEIPEDTGGGAISGLLAETFYIFSVVPVNQYGISGMDDENVISITTSATEAPAFPNSTLPSNSNYTTPDPPKITRVAISGGCLELKFEMGGSGATFYQYVVVVSSPSDDFHASYNVTVDRLDVCDLLHDTVYIVSAAVDDGDKIGEKQVISAATGALSEPSLVVGLIASITTSGYSKLSWKAPVDKGGLPIKLYEIDIINQGTDEVRHIEVPGSELTATISFLAASTPYMLSVRAINGGNRPGPESTVIVWTGNAVAPQQPPPPELVSATGGALYVTIVAPIDCGGSDLRSYDLNIARRTGGTLEYRQYASGPIQSLHFDRRVANVSIYGLLSKSDEENIYSTSAPSPARGMAPPTVVAENPGEITLIWDKPLDSGGLSIVGYSVQQRHIVGDGSWSLYTTVYDDRSSLVQTALISNIAPKTLYAFSVVAYNFRTLCRPDEYVTPSDELLITSQDDSLPSQPQNLRGVNVTGGSITLVWDSPRSSGEQPLRWYLVNGSIEGSSLLRLANISATTGNSVVLYGFTALTVYEFAVAGDNGLGIGPYSSILRVTTTSISIPGKPTNLYQIPASSGGTIILTWDPPADSGGTNIQQYMILRDGTEVAVVTKTPFVDQHDVEATTSYIYSVFASNDVASGKEGATLIASSSSASISSPPSATVEATGGSVKVIVTPPQDSGGTPVLYFILTLLRGNVFVDVYNTSDTTSTIPGLYAETQYSVRVQAVNKVARSDPTVLNVSTIFAEPPDKMEAPTLVSRTGGSLCFRINPPANFGGAEISSYDFYLNESSTPITVVKISSTEYEIMGLTALTVYSVAVTAENAVGSSDRSTPTIISTTSLTAPGRVLNFEAVFQSYNAIEVSWTVPLDSGGNESAVNYEAKLTTIGMTSYTTVCTTSSAIFSDLQPATIYIIQVRANNTAGVGPWSASINVTTDPVSPGIISFSTNETTVSEAGLSVTLTLIRTMGGYTPAKCNFTTIDGTAVAGVQYLTSRGQVEFGRNMSSQRIIVPIINNAITDDPDKYFFVSIQPSDNKSGLIGAVSTTKVTIMDDGDAGILAFEQTSYNVSESTPTLTVTILRNGAFSDSGDIAIDIFDTEEAVTGIDFTVRSNVSFSDQQRNASVSIGIINDTTYQKQKMFQLVLRSIRGRLSVGDPPATSTIVILDDSDVSPPGLPTSVQITKLSGGAVNVSWLPPGHLGAKIVSVLSYNVSVLDVQSKLNREQTAETCYAMILQLTARSAYQISIAAKNDKLIGQYTSPMSITMGGPTPASAPLNIQVLSRTGGMITLTWDAPLDFGGVDIVGYRAIVCRSADEFYVGLYTTSDMMVSANSLDPLTNYTVIVEAVSKNGLVGNASAPVLLATVAASVPGKPENLVITRRTGGALYMAMGDPLDAGGSLILTYTLFMTSALYPTIFRQGTSELSDIFTTATSYLSPPDEAQNIVVRSRTGGSVNLSWTPPLDFGGSNITAYDVAFFLGPPVRSQFRQRVTGINPDATSVTAKVVGLLANSTYGFSVVGINDVSICENPSAILSRTIVYSSTDTLITLPDIPHALTITWSTSGVQMIQWSGSEDTGGGNFVAYRLYSESGEILYDGPNTVFLRGSLTKNTQYGYAVSAWNSAGSSNKCAFVFATTSAEVVAPSQPLDLTQVNSTGGSIGLEWKMPMDCGGDKIAGYRVIRNGIRIVDIGANETTFVDDTDLVADQRYVYSVHASNSVGLGPSSDEVSASTASATVPHSLKSLVVTATGGTLNVSWIPAADTGGIPLTFFHLQVLNDSLVVFETKLANTSLSYNLYGVRSGTTYVVRVTAGNQKGESKPAAQRVTSGAALRPGAPRAPEQYLDLVALPAWTIRLKLYLPVDDGGGPISKLVVYQNGSKASTISIDTSAQAVLGEPTTRYTLSDIGPLHAGFIYSYEVSALSSVETVGEGARSSAIQVKMGPATLPSTPLNFVVGLRTSFSVSFQWDEPTDTGGDDISYEISYINTNTSETFGISVSTITVEIPKLIPGNIYSFRLRALNSAGSSAWTQSLTTQTDLTQRGVITYSILSSTVFENVSTVTVYLVRVNGSSGTVSCHYTNGPGTAIYDQDYTLPPESDRSFSFYGELTMQSFNVTIINDAIYEPSPRTIHLILTDTTPDRTDPISPTTITISILDDGDAGTIGFATSAVSVRENARVVSLRLQRLNGWSSATSVKVVVYSQLNSTAKSGIDFRLPSVSIDFLDQQVQADASIVIKDNDIYDFPYLYFYLSVEISAGKATIGDYRVIRVEVEDDGDCSPPGLMDAPTCPRATGGMLVLAWTPPINVGGGLLWITAYNISIQVGSLVKWLVTSTNATTWSFGGLNALTKHNFSICAINTIGQGPSSPGVTFMTTSFTTPGAPARINLLSQTGGLITVNVSVPADTGGATITGYLIYLSEQDEVFQVGKVKDTIANKECIAQCICVLRWRGYDDISYMIYYREQGSGKRLRKAYCHSEGLNITIYRLGASITYNMVAVSVIANDTDQIASGTIIMEDSKITLMMLSHATNSEYGCIQEYIFEIDQSKIQPDGSVYYLTSLSTDNGIPASTELMTDGSDSELFLRGTFSDIFNYTTASPTNPGMPPAPIDFDSYGTGGALFITISWPDDTETPEQYVFSTDEASVPEPILLIESIGVTGSGIHVKVTPPVDRGSDHNLYYQIYFSKDIPKKNWKLGYNGTDTSYWQTKLQKESSYSFKATCMNDVDYSINSTEYSLSTTFISPPGPPSGLKSINRTGGTIHFSWMTPEDDGGSDITSYLVRAIDTAGNTNLVMEVVTSQIVFGGLIANKKYDFNVFAENSLGIGSDSGKATFSTTLPTLPSLPGNPVVLGTTGGSITLAIQPPTDTGGVIMDDLTWNVYANNVKVLPNAVRRINSIMAASANSITRRLTSTDSGDIIYLQAGGLLPSTAYVFTIQVGNEVGLSDITNGVEKMTTLATVPGQPNQPTAKSITGGAMTLEWIDPVDTGGAPLTSYRLSVNGLQGEVGYCEGLIMSCTVGNLAMATEYTVTLVAYNPVGVSPPSDNVTFSTISGSLPKEPQDVHIAEVSDTSVTIHWSPCTDFGGGYVVSYQVDISQMSEPNIAFSCRVPVTQSNCTINTLSPMTDYNSTVIQNSTGEDISYEDNITLGETYAYQLQVKRLDGSLSILSEITRFVASIPHSPGFDCVGSEGYIHWHEYRNSDIETWTIYPHNQSGIVINITMFWLECNHDFLAINTTENGETKQLWKGGCHREGGFVVATTPGIDSVVITFVSDNSITYEGMALHYESVDASSAAEYIKVPCPVTSSGLCSLNGACRQGSCSCFSGFVGESCSNVIICPKDTACTTSTCDPICDKPQSDVIVVSVNGDDAQGTGELMDTSVNGTDPKAVQSLNRALQLVNPNQTILVYPGIYKGAGNCSVTISKPDIAIRGLRGPTVTTFDCLSTHRGLIVKSVSIRMEGFTLRNTYSSLNGAAISALNATLQMENLNILNATSLQNGGAIWAYGANLTLTTSKVSNCSASVNGGAIFMDMSNLTLKQSTIEQSLAKLGGGIYAQNATMVTGDGQSLIWKNNATLKGGGICSAGVFNGIMLNISRNTGFVGGGISVITGNSNLSVVFITENRAIADGGGIALLNTGSLILYYSPLRQNHAERNGGGIYVGTNGTFENKVASDVFNCTAASGGGLFCGDWAHPTLTALTVSASSASVKGGCAAFTRCSAIMNNASLNECSAPSGAGLYAGTRSNVSILNGIVKAGKGTTGAGLYINSSWVIGGNGKDNNSIVQDGQAEEAGGAVFITGTQSSIQYVNVRNCSASNGGGIFIQNVSSGTMVSMFISDNNATKSGGGIFVETSTVKMADIVVRNNTAIIGGGGFITDASLSGSISITDNIGEQGGGLASFGLSAVEGASITSNQAQERGGGVSIETGELELKNTNIAFCFCEKGFGGGISVTNASVKHHALTVQNCYSTRGGGVYVNASKVYQYPTDDSSRISDVVSLLTNNHATDYGGSIFIDGFGSQISDVVITRSYAPLGGGIVALYAHDCNIQNMDISTSNATSGGGLFIGSGSNCTLRNSRVTNNNATESGGGLVVHSATLHHSSLNITSNAAPTGAGVSLRSDLMPSSLLWERPTTEKSNIYANVVVPPSGNGVNVLLNCSVECVLSGAQIFGGSTLIGQGAGVFVRGGGNTMISDVLIANNSAANGGGIAVNETNSTTLENVALVGNFASDRGGGLWASGADLSYYPTINLTRCVFYNNSATSYGGAVYLYKTVINSSVLLAVENHVNDSEAGSGGGFYVDQKSDITADNWLFLSNDAAVGGAMTEVASSKISLLESNFTRDVTTFFTKEWQDLFFRSVGFTYVKGLARYKVDVQKGGIIYISDEGSELELLSGFVTYGSADAGGGIYLDNSAFFYGSDAEIVNNSATERGGGLCVSNSAQALFDSVTISFCGKHVIWAELNCFTTQFVGNGGLTSSGKNEGGGAISIVDGSVYLTNCLLENNTAVVGGAIHVDRGGSATIFNSFFMGNSADELGGAIATELHGNLTVAQQTSFQNNMATLGGAISSSGSSKITIEAISCFHNQASEDGGAIFITDQATLASTQGNFVGNTAVLGGAIHSDARSVVYISGDKFVGNVASLRGGAIYYESIINTTTTKITCRSNRAPSGGCLFWISDGFIPIYPCTDCTMESNSVYDIATNTRDVQVLWWPKNVTSGIPILEPPDEESIEVLDALNQTLEAIEYVWPRLKAVDLYGQIEVIDNETECTVSDGLCSDQTERLTFTPTRPIRALIGVISYNKASFTAVNQSVERGVYTSNITCTIPASETREFRQSVQLLPCQPGFSVKQG